MAKVVKKVIRSTSERKLGRARATLKRIVNILGPESTTCSVCRCDKCIADMVEALDEAVKGLNKIGQ